MNQFKIAFIILLLGLFSSGCYTVVYNTVEGDVYSEGPTYYPPPPDPIQPIIIQPPGPPYIGGPHPHPRPNPLRPIFQLPETEKERKPSYGNRDDLRNHGGRNPGGRTPKVTIESRKNSKTVPKGENNR